MLNRTRHVQTVERLLRRSPVVAILGARQVGKTTLALQVFERSPESATRFDLEDRRDLARLEEPMLTLEPLRGLVVLDEIHRRPDLFPTLRVLADRPGTPARFLVLGSASPELLRQGSQTLAGRIAFHQLGGFDLEEVGSEALDRLWFRGAFPRSFLAADDRESDEWRTDFVRTFIERDLPGLGVGVAPATLARFWSMTAHYHGQTWNGSELAGSLGVSHTTVRRYLDLLAATFVVRLLTPWAENVGKRVVKSPKVFVADSGLLHALLGLHAPEDVAGHPKLGASWEGFLVSQVIRRLGVAAEACHFWATHAGAELDLLVVHGRRRLGFEFKRTDAPRVTPSMRSAAETLRLDRLALIHAGSTSFDLGPSIRAIAARDLLVEVPVLRG
jgi:hypothetical protein